MQMEFSRLTLLPIPASIRRRLPRLYPSHKAGADTTSDAAFRLSLSEPHLACPSHLTEIAVEVQGPLTASNDLNFESGSGGSGGSGGSTPREGTDLPPAYETESGLRWNRIVPAFNLLRNAGYEAQQPRADGRLARSLYINAIMYLLDALPPDLTVDEITMIQHRIPQPVKASIAAEPRPQSHLACLEGPVDSRPGPPARSCLHRLLAFTIVQMFLIVRFILPYIKLFLRQVYEYERSHRLTERIVTMTLDAADGLGKSSVNIGSTVCKLNEGRVGTVVGNLATWWVEGIAGGVYEGVGQGMMHLGLLRPGPELNRPILQINGR